MVLIYLGEQRSLQPAFETILQRMQLSYRFLDDTQTSATLNELFAQTEDTHDALALAHPLMVMKDVSDAQFQHIMKQFRSAGLAMERKAMWTVHNQDWRFAQLAEEIEEEHRYFAQREQLYAIFSASNQKDPCAYTAESWRSYAQTLGQLVQRLANEQPSPQALGAMLEEAKAAEAALTLRCVLHKDK